MWITFTLLSLLIFLLSVAAATLRGIQRKRYRLSPLYILLIGVFIADFLALFPPYYLTVLEGNGILKSLFMVFHDTLQLFTINNDFSLILEHAHGISEMERNLYTVYVAFLYAFTPILTVGVGLSFFRNLSAYCKYFFHYNSDVYVFSDWNDKTATLAKSIVEKDSRAVILLTSRDKESEEDEELNRKARDVGSIDFASHICDLHLGFHSKAKRISFFFLKDTSYSASENVEEAIATLKQYADRENTFLYVFSNVNAHEAILNAQKGKALVRRINSMQSLIQMFLYKKGIEIFESAKEDTDGVKRISIALVGFGSYGAEFLRALPWFVTQKGYQTEIHVFDKKKDAISSFQALYPDLNYANSPRFIEDAFYSIHFHEMSADSLEFAKLIEQTPFTFAFVITGDNDRNLRISLQLRTMFERKKEKPLIYTRISSPVLSNCSTELFAMDGQKYDVRLIGSIEDTYSYESIIESEWQTLAKQSNYRWLNLLNNTPEMIEKYRKQSDERFWQYELVYSSSIAEAIHSAIRKQLDPYAREIPIDVEPDWQHDEDARLEHARWVTFSYAQGYIYAPEKNNRLALTNKFLPANDEERRAILRRM